MKKRPRPEARGNDQGVCEDRRRFHHQGGRGDRDRRRKHRDGKQGWEPSPGTRGASRRRGVDHGRHRRNFRRALRVDQTGEHLQIRRAVHDLLTIRMRHPLRREGLQLRPKTLKQPVFDRRVRRLAQLGPKERDIEFGPRHRAVAAGQPYPVNSASARSPACARNPSERKTTITRSFERHAMTAQDIPDSLMKKSAT